MVSDHSVFPTRQGTDLGLFTGSFYFHQVMRRMGSPAGTQTSLDRHDNAVLVESCPRLISHYCKEEDISFYHFYHTKM